MAESTEELLQQVARGLRRRFTEALVSCDVTPSQARALKVVCEEAPLRLSILAERLRIAPRSATEVVDALEAAGLVRRTPDPGDRRATRLDPTDAGRALRTRIGRARRTASEDLLAGLGDADRRELDRILRLLVD